jgi:hypothetical protein
MLLACPCGSWTVLCSGEVEMCSCEGPRELQPDPLCNRCKRDSWTILLLDYHNSQLKGDTNSISPWYNKIENKTQPTLYTLPTFWVSGREILSKSCLPHQKRLAIVIICKEACDRTDRLVEQNYFPAPQELADLPSRTSIPYQFVREPSL